MIIGIVNEAVDSFPSINQLVVCWAELKKNIYIYILIQIDLHLNNLTLIFFYVDASQVKKVPPDKRQMGVSFSLARKSLRTILHANE